MARATYHGVKDLLTEKAFYYYKICLCRGATYSSSWTGDNVATWEHLWIGLQVQGCQFLEWDLLLSVDSQNNLQVIYMRGGFNWVFSSFCGHTLQGIMEIRPWAFDEDIIDITRKFVNLRYQLFTIYHVLAIY
jgi:alpha-glucosidase